MASNATPSEIPPSDGVELNDAAGVMTAPIETSEPTSPQSSQSPSPPPSAGPQVAEDSAAVDDAETACVGVSATDNHVNVAAASAAERPASVAVADEATSRGVDTSALQESSAVRPDGERVAPNAAAQVEAVLLTRTARDGTAHGCLSDPATTPTCADLDVAGAENDACGQNSHEQIITNGSLPPPLMASAETDVWSSVAVPLTGVPSAAAQRPLSSALAGAAVEDRAQSLSTHHGATTAALSQPPCVSVHQPTSSPVRSPSHPVAEEAEAEAEQREEGNAPEPPQDVKEDRQQASEIGEGPVADHDGDLLRHERHDASHGGHRKPPPPPAPRAKRGRDDKDEACTIQLSRYPHAPAIGRPAASRDAALLPDTATREHVSQLQHLLMSLFPASLRTQYAPQEAEPIRAAAVVPRPHTVKCEEATEATAEQEDVVASQAETLLSLLEDVAEDKMFVRAAWQRCQEAHQLRRQKLAKRRHHAPLSRLTGGGGTASQRRRQPQNDPDDGGPVRSAEDSPIGLFHFMDWDPRSCWRHYAKKQQVAARRAPAGSAANQSPFLNAILQDREEYVDTVERQLGNDAVAAAVPVTLAMMLPAKEEENYARYVLSNGKLRRECLEPFQFLSTRARVVREELLTQYMEGRAHSSNSDNNNSSASGDAS